jgi:hypothetical protein
MEYYNMVEQAYYSYDLRMVQDFMIKRALAYSAIGKLDSAILELSVARLFQGTTKQHFINDTLMSLINRKDSKADMTVDKINESYDIFYEELIKAKNMLSPKTYKSKGKYLAVFDPIQKNLRKALELCPYNFYVYCELYNLYDASGWYAKEANEFKQKCFASLDPRHSSISFDFRLGDGMYAFYHPNENKPAPSNSGTGFNTEFDMYGNDIIFSIDASAFKQFLDYYNDAEYAVGKYNRYNSKGDGVNASFALQDAEKAYEKAANVLKMARPTYSETVKTNRVNMIAYCQKQIARISDVFTKHAAIVDEANKISLEQLLQGSKKKN